MKRILIALDYDPTAQKVAETGELLCNLAGDLVTLLHVIDSPAYYISAEYNHLSCAKMLVQHGADIYVHGAIETKQNRPNC